MIIGRVSCRGRLEPVFARTKAWFESAIGVILMGLGAKWTGKGNRSADMESAPQRCLPGVAEFHGEFGVARHNVEAVIGAGHDE